MKEVNVTNKHPKTVGPVSYQGMTFVFEPGKKVAIPVDAAVNIFGFNQKDRFDARRRLGFTDKEKGEAWLDNFDLEFVEYVRKEEVDELEGLKIELEKANLRIRELEGEITKLQMGAKVPHESEKPKVTKKGK